MRMFNASNHIMSKFKQQYSLIKPGIVYGNLIAGAAGFFLASQGNIDWLHFALIMLSIACIVSSGCIINNMFDRDIDGKMKRTKNRVLVTGEVPLSSAYALGIATFVAGFGILLMFSNKLTLLMGVLGFFVYVVVYTMWTKRHSVHSTVVGSISGACPPVMGYVAVTNSFDIGAVLLLCCFCIWQIPHSYAIAIFRFDDYKAANIPVLPITKGIDTARWHMLVCTVGFTAGCLLFSQFNYVGDAFAVTMMFIGLYWTYVVSSGSTKQPTQQWGRKMFILSIIAISCFSLLLSIDFKAPTIAVF